MTRRRITRPIGLLVLAAAWLLLQQLAWVHGLSHVTGPHAGGQHDAGHHEAAWHTGVDDHGHGDRATQGDAPGGHPVCCACMGLHSAGAALPSAAPTLPAGTGTCAAPPQRAWVSASLAPWWSWPSRAPPALLV